MTPHSHQSVSQWSPIHIMILQLWSTYRLVYAYKTSRAEFELMPSRADHTLIHIMTATMITLSFYDACWLQTTSVTDSYYAPFVAIIVSSYMWLLTYTLILRLWSSNDTLILLVWWIFNVLLHFFVRLLSWLLFYDIFCCFMSSRVLIMSLNLCLMCLVTLSPLSCIHVTNIVYLQIIYIYIYMLKSSKSLMALDHFLYNNNRISMWNCRSCLL
jgi:hypothetical protein